MRGLPSILLLFRNKFNKFNKTRAQMLDSNLSYGIKITLKSHFWCKKSLYTQRYYGLYFIHVTLPENL